MIPSDPVMSCSVATRDYEPRERNCRGQALALIDLARPPSPGSISEMAMLRQLPADLAEPSGVKLPLVPTECHEHCVEVVLHFPRVALIERVDGATHTAANL